MQEQIQQLLSEIAIAGSILPPLLMLIPKFWSDNAKKAATFLASLVLTVIVAMQNAEYRVINFQDVPTLVAHLIVILIVAHQTYNNVWAPATQTLAKMKSLKFLNRSNRTEK